MKKFSLLFTAVVLSVQLFAYDPVNEKLAKSFKDHFPNAAQVTWQELPDAYVVSFVATGIRSRAIFDKNGELIRVTRFYHEEHLPYQIMYKIKRAFAHRTIFGVIEVSTPEGAGDTTTEYYVKLEDDKSWITVKVTAAGALYVTEKLRK